jgi:hypothetical protein
MANDVGTYTTPSSCLNKAKLSSLQRMGGTKKGSVRSCFFLANLGEIIREFTAIRLSPSDARQEMRVGAKATTTMDPGTLHKKKPPTISRPLE